MRIHKYVKWDGFLADDWQLWPALSSDLPHRLVFTDDVTYVLTFDPFLSAAQRVNVVQFLQRKSRRIATIKPRDWYEIVYREAAA